MENSESDIESACNKLVKALGGQHRKLDTGRGGKGWLDQAYWLPGRHFIVEFKRPGEGLTPLQKRKRLQLQALGVEVHVIDNVHDFARLLEAATR